MSTKEPSLQARVKEILSKIETGWSNNEDFEVVPIGTTEAIKELYARIKEVRAWPY